MIEFLDKLFKNDEAEADKAKELKRLSAQEQRLVDMLAKYTDEFLRGRTKAQIVNVLNDIEKVLGDKKYERK